MTTVDKLGLKQLLIEMLIRMNEAGEPNKNI
jgi:hypothetical protein